MNPQNPEEPLNEEKLQEELQAYKQAYQQEYEVELKAEPDQAAEATQDFFKKNMPIAAAQIVWLAENADSETVRGNMSKFIIERGTMDAENDGDPMKAMLDKLTRAKPREKEKT